MSDNFNKIMQKAHKEYWQHTPDMAFVKDISGVYIDSSQPFAEMTGWQKAEDIIGKTDFEIFADKKLAKRYTEDDARLLAGNVSLENYVEPITSKNERPRYCITSKYILRDDEGKPIGIFGISRDITTEYEAKQNYESELKGIFELPPDAIMTVLIDITSWRVVDTRYRDEYSNVVAQYGTVDEYFENAFHSVIEDESTRGFFRSASQKFFQKEYNSGKRSYSLEYLRMMQDGTKRWIRDEFRFLNDPVNGNLAIIMIMRDIDESKREYSELIRAAKRDSMTGLLNRKATEKSIISHIEGAEGLQALFVIDLDNFKQVNDNFGHQYGDAVLVQAADAIKNVFRNTDVVGRIGGDEFMVLMKNVNSKGIVCEKANAVIEAMRFSLDMDKKNFKLTTSIGITIFTSGDSDFNTLYNEADAALYSAKKNGKNCYNIFKEGVKGGKFDNTSLELQSGNDELTGIPGKQAFYRNVRKTLEENPDGEYAIIRFDINRFKVFNDVCGTSEGDKLLCDIAVGIQKNSGRALQYGRLESDHFALLLPDDCEVIERSKQELEKWIARRHYDFRISFTIGVYSIVDPSIDVSFMCDRALLALESVKSGFETRLAYYDYTLRKQLIDEQHLVSDMEDALKNEQFELYFQPQVNYDTGETVGAEALVRWKHPTRGLLGPSVFIPLFEKNGLITSLDEYVWKRCCLYIQRWNETYQLKDGLPISISVNVSRLDINDPKLCATFKSFLHAYGLSASALRLEITESAYMDNPQQLIDTVDELQKAGFVIEMDDFGSGYSSLNTLKDVPVDVLKLDMKFLEDCADSSRGGNILSSVIRMAHWLKLPIIAEGVETKAQADYLKSLGCLYMQGYYFSRPMNAEAFEELLGKGAVSLLDKYKDIGIEGMAAFWDASEQTALLFNSFVGGAAIMEYRRGILEASRVNDNFYKAMGTTREKFSEIRGDLLSCFDEENRAKALNEVYRAIYTGEECGYEIKYNLGPGGITKQWNYVRMRLLARNNDTSILYVSIEDITDRKQLEQEREIESERTRLLMQTTGTAFFDYDYATDTLNYKLYIPDKGVEKRIVTNCIDSWSGDDILHPDSAVKLQEMVRKSKFSHADGELEFKADLWGNGMRWCRLWYASVEDINGQGYRMVGQADDIQDIKDREALSEAIRQHLETETPAYMFNDNIVSRIFDLFYETSDIGDTIERTFSLLGEHYDLNRIYIFEDIDAHAAAKNTFEWCAAECECQKSSLQYMRYEDLGGRDACAAYFDHQGIFYCKDIKALSPKLREALEARGADIMLQCAIKDDGEFTGFIGFEGLGGSAGWTDEQIGTLLFVSRIVSLFLIKMRNLDNMAFSADFRAALDDNAAYIYIIDPQTYEVIYSNKAVQEYSGKSHIGDICYKEFIGREEPCDECPVRALSKTGKNRAAEIVRADGMVLLSQASPMRWNGQEMAMVSCTDITDSK